MPEKQVYGYGNTDVPYFSVNAVWLVVVVCLAIAAILSSNSSLFAVLSILMRGILGLGSIVNGFYWIISDKWPFRSQNLSMRSRRFGGGLLIVVGLIAVITAFLGYGFNGHEPFMWWKNS